MEDSTNKTAPEGPLPWMIDGIEVLDLSKDDDLDDVKSHMRNIGNSSDKGIPRGPLPRTTHGVEILDLSVDDDLDDVSSHKRNIGSNSERFLGRLPPTKDGMKVLDLTTDDLDAPVEISSIEFFRPFQPTTSQASSSKRRRTSISTAVQHRPSKKPRETTSAGTGFPERRPSDPNTELASDYDEDEWGEQPFRPSVPDFNADTNSIDHIYQRDREIQLEKARNQALRELIDSIPLEDRTPMGARKRRLVRRKDLKDDEDGNGSNDGVDGKFDDGMANEDAIEADRVKIEEAAGRLGCKRTKRKFTRKEEIVASNERGEVVATVGREEVSSSGSATPAKDTTGKRKQNESLLPFEIVPENDDEPILSPPASHLEGDMEWIEGDQLGKRNKGKHFRDVVEIKEMWRLPGMQTPLLDHQVLGVDWMLTREFSSKSSKGGLVADAMGLGKTIQSLGTMVMNKPIRTKNLQEPLVTLIVAPVSLLQQWKFEIETHIKPGILSVYIHHGPGKVNNVRSLQRKDVVITSYSTVMLSLPSPKRPRRKMSVEEFNSWWQEKWDNERGILHRMKFWRVILDEAHIIKNRYSRTSLACQKLDAVYTWALSGTPIQNSLHDIFPVLSFLKHPYAGIMENFQELVQGKDDARNAQRVQAILRGVMMRRKKDDLLMGKPLITLPKRRIRMVQLEFSEEERSLYNAVEHMSRERMNRFVQAGTVLKNYQHVLTMLLRLRQICNHPYLILNCINVDFTVTDIDRALRLEEGEDLTHTSDNESEDSDPLPDAATPSWSVSQIRSTRSCSKPHVQPEGRSSGLRMLLEAVKPQCPSDIEECAICFDSVEAPVMTPCKHIFCRDCVNNVITRAAQEGCPGLCPVCNREMKLNEWTALDTENGMEVEGVGEWLDRVKGELVRSAKLIGMKNQLEEWRNNHPGDKVVLFSQFVKMLDIVEKVAEEEGWEIVRYQGGMSISDREEVLLKFRNDPEAWIMLTSLKAGGVGLNLTHANLVISLDLWWNAAMETQAFERVHRMGQYKEVFVTRFIVKNTVEQRILDLQRRKQKLVDAAMGEGEGRLGRLSVRELMGLFGRVVEDGNGKMHIEADYDRNGVIAF